MLRKAFSRFLSLVKILQTILLLVTGVAGYMSGVGLEVDPLRVLVLMGSLFLTISGSTVLNMWFDSDIDSKMDRTCLRPVPTGKVTPKEALILGLLMSLIGVGWALWEDTLYGIVVFAGLFFDVVVYTIWLKRRSAWSIIWGGVAGGMPVLAGRVLAVGHVDWVGVLLATAVLFWIPTHIMTFSMRYDRDYRTARIPTFPAKYGFDMTRKMVAGSSVVAVALMVASALGTGITGGLLDVLAVISVGLLLLSISAWTKPSDKVNFRLFKFASMYMLGAMVILIAQGL